MKTKIKLGEYKHEFDQLDVAVELGRKLWDRDTILEFSEVDSVPVPFLQVLLQTAFENRDYASAIQFVDLDSMSENVQNEFLQVYTALGESGRSPILADDVKVPGPNGGIFNPFSTLEDIQRDYLSYVESFQQIKSQEIKNWIEARLEGGGLLWKPPYIQISLPFMQGEPLEKLVDEGILHSGVLKFARSEKNDPNSAPISPYLHQIEAIRTLHQGGNVIVATGTGSGKSFAFGIPIVSTALKLKERGVKGIKAVIVYPMNALANNQYDDFTERLHRSGLRIGRYTGDTKTNPEKALALYQTLTGRKVPYDCEVLSRAEIQADPPDILMTNYVMLELLLTRFEDRTLFRHQGVLKYLVLDEVHTYSGKKGADVAALIRRLKQHTGTIGKLTCIGTSATVESGEDESAQEAISGFASELFGETFPPADVVGETYAPIPDSLDPKIQGLLGTLQSGPKTITLLSTELNLTRDELVALILNQPDLPPKIHTFFSQGRPIHSCIGDTKHLNDRGERLCPTCADQDKGSPTFPLVFCRSCGAEYYSVTRFEGSGLASAELDSVSTEGQSGYILILDPESETAEDLELPEIWLTPTGKVRKKYRELIPTFHTICRHCGEIDPTCGHERYKILFIPVPFLFCPECGVEHDMRLREYSKLFSYGTVGRSTATDIILNAELRNLPEKQRKVIAFSDNRQDTALQAAHINSMSNRMQFRRLLYNTLKELDATIEADHFISFSQIGLQLFNMLNDSGLMPPYDANQERRYGRAAQQIGVSYQRYLQFLTLRELEGTHRRIHQNLEDIGAMFVGYDGLDEFAADEPVWAEVPYLKDLTPDKRFDILHGIMDMMRLRLAVKHEAIIRPDQFNTEVISRINPEVHVHDGEFYGAIGYSDDAPTGRNHRAYRLSSSNTQMNRWLRKFADLSTNQAAGLLTSLINMLHEAGFLVSHTVRGFGGVSGDIFAVDPEIISLQVDDSVSKQVCPRCLSVYHFREIRSCYKTTCRSSVVDRDISHNYFLQMYTQPLGIAVDLKAEEHSGQISGDVRMDIEQRFKDPENDLNVIVCTPTMELGIDIGDLNVVALRNIPPSPSNYAQRAGRAGRKGQAALITAYAGVGFARGPHDQYFFRFPEKMISGVISAPRFRLDNTYLIRTHIHSLVLEVMGLGLEDLETGKVFKGLKLPASPREILEIDHNQYPMLPDLLETWENAIQKYGHQIQAAVIEAFTGEIEHFDWFTPEWVGETISDFVNDLDQALDYWRNEYHSLYQEGREIENHLLMIQGDKARNDRMNIISAKLTSMRNGEGDWYIYRYLGSQGFLPGYAFPPQATYLAFNDSEDEIGRNPVIAISEYAPGNYIYYRGSSYKIIGARAQTLNLMPSTQKVLICPECERVYLGDEETNRARCNCGQDLSLTHSKNGMAMCNMYARPDAKISSDEEERRRLGYDITPHFRGGGYAQRYSMLAGGEDVGSMTLETNGKIFIMNHGQRLRDGTVFPFELCTRCNRWLLSENEIEEHYSTAEQKGKCNSNANQEDILRDLGLTHEFQSDVLVMEVKLPEGGNPDAFYTSLITAFARGIMIAFNLEESEIGYFLSKSPDPEVPYQMIIYETSLGGTGCLAALAIETEFNRVVNRIREILHDFDDEGCEGACYQCLLSFYNQRHHHNLDRNVVLEWLQGVEEIEIQRIQVDDGKYEQLFEACGSDLERDVLTAINNQNIRLPDEGQKTIYDNEGIPLANADFFYAPKVIVFVDGSPHHLDYVRLSDEVKRKKLKGKGYRIVVIKGEDVDGGIDELARRIS